MSVSNFLHYYGKEFGVTARDLVCVLESTAISSSRKVYCFEGANGNKSSYIFDADLCMCIGVCEGYHAAPQGYVRMDSIDGKIFRIGNIVDSIKAEIADLQEVHNSCMAIVNDPAKKNRGHRARAERAAHEIERLGYDLDVYEEVLVALELERDVQGA